MDDTNNGHGDDLIITSNTKTGPSVLTTEHLKEGLTGKKGEELEFAAIELIEKAAAMSPADIAKVTVFLRKNGVTKRGAQAWRNAVRETKKYLQVQPACSEEESSDNPVDIALAILNGDKKTGCKSLHIAKDAGDKLYVFEGGVYRPYGREKIKKRAQELLAGRGLLNHWTTYREKQILEFIRVCCPRLWEKPPPNKINLLNGILDIDTMALRPHNPEFLSPIQIPVRYDQDATCPETEKFVRDVYPADAFEAGVPWEISAWLLMLDAPTQKALLLLGLGGNGKSRELARLRALVGIGNITTKSLHNLELNRFSTSSLVGKLANICPDLPSKDLESVSVFKSIVGGDFISGEYKHGAQFQFRPFCKLLFAANSPPVSRDSTDGFFRKWLCINFEGRFDTSEQHIPAEILDARLSHPGELSGVLNKALDVWDRVHRIGLTETESMKLAREDLRSVTDTFLLWLGKYTITSPLASVPCAILNQTYNEVAEKYGWTRYAASTFGQMLKRVRPSIRRVQRTVNGKPKVWVYKGIELVESLDVSENGQESLYKSPESPADPYLDGKRNEIPNTPIVGKSNSKKNKCEIAGESSELGDGSTCMLNVLSGQDSETLHDDDDEVIYL